MNSVAIDQIDPPRIVDAFGNYKIGVAESVKGTGGPDDGRFMNLDTDWKRDPAPVLKELFLRDLVRRARQGRYNFIEFWGWPKVIYRDDGMGMVRGRLRMLHVIVDYAPRVPS